MAGDGVGAHALVRLRVQLLKVGVAGTHGEHAPVLDRHHLGAAGHDQVVHAGHDPVGGDVVGRDARAAEAVERHAAGLDVVAGVEGRHAPEVAALGADLGAGAPHDVVDVGGVEPVALHQCLEHGAAEVLGVEVGDRALALLADPAGRADSVDDQCVGHAKGLHRPDELDRHAHRAGAWQAPARRTLHRAMDVSVSPSWWPRRRGRSGRAPPAHRRTAPSRSSWRGRSGTRRWPCSGRCWPRASAVRRSSPRRRRR